MLCSKYKSSWEKSSFENLKKSQETQLFLFIFWLLPPKRVIICKESLHIYRAKFLVVHVWCACVTKNYTHTTTQSRKRNKQAFFICSVSDPLRRVQTTNERATSPARAREKVNSSRARPKQRICFFDLLNQFLVFVRH